MPTCSNCDGKGYTDCETCYGSGELGDDRCDDCDGDGTNPCENCGGYGDIALGPSDYGFDSLEDYEDNMF